MGASLMEMLLHGRFRDGLLVLSTFVLVGGLGCASQGPLKPPSLHLPGRAEHVTAQRVGDRVNVAWTTPARTTDGDAVKGAMTAAICVASPPFDMAMPGPGRGKKLRRGASGSGGSGPLVGAGCVVVERMVATPGVSSVLLALPPAMVSGEPKLFAYRVELLNAANHSAGPAGMAFMASGAAPAAVGTVTVSAQRDGALVRWTPTAGKGRVELKRTLAAGSATEAKPVRAGKTAVFSAQAATGSVAEITLAADPAEASDAGGMIDTGVRDGETYDYVAQRVEEVSVGGQRVQLRSVASRAVTFTYRQTFPPKAPVGLALVPSGGAGGLSIDLSWEPSLERDVAGYHVYRSVDAGPFRRLDAELGSAPAFRDLQVQAGRRYTYRVTAVDQRGNESDASATAMETIRQ